MISILYAPWVRLSSNRRPHCCTCGKTIIQGNYFITSTDWPNPQFKDLFSHAKYNNYCTNECAKVGILLENWTNTW